MADGDVVKGSWRPEEDRRLCEILHELGGCKNPGFSWSDVAKTLGGGRTGKSCRLRWCGLAPGRGAGVACLSGASSPVLTRA